MVPLSIQSGPVGTIAIPAEPRRLVGSRCSWNAVVKSSSNGTEGEDELVIYRRCYECNINVPYHVYIN